MLPRKIVVYISILSFSLLFPLSFNVLLAQESSGEVIESFKSTAEITQEGVVNVTEEIDYNFGADQRHGIFRKIKRIFTNNQGEKYETPITVNSVTDAQGNSVNFVTSTTGDYLELKIGSADTFVTGLQNYVINYTVIGALEEYTDHIEYYPNVTGNKTLVPTKEVIFKAVLPPEVPSNSLKGVCFTGPLNSTQTNCDVQIIENTVQVRTTQPLQPSEGLSVAVSFDKGYVNLIPKKEVEEFELNPVTQSVLAFLAVLYYLVLPVYLIFHYFRKGKDPQAKYSSVPPLFEPPKDELGHRLTPAEVGTIIDEKVDPKDISATIVDLAIRGYLRIEEVEKEGMMNSLAGAVGLKKEKDYILHLKEKDISQLKSFEQKLLNLLFGNEIHAMQGLSSIFQMLGSASDVPNSAAFIKGPKSVKISSFKNSTSLFYGLRSLQSTLYKDLTTKGFFEKNPEKVRSNWGAISVVLFLTLNIIAGFVALLLVRAMPKKTPKGVNVNMEGKGLLKFLSSQEKQLEFQELNWHMFEKLLPYAVAFGVTETWAKRFKHLTNIPQTDWYSGTSLVNNPAHFANSITNLNSTLVSTTRMTTTQSRSGFSSGFSSGGGFSGGGSSGGGGTGSW